MVKVADHPIDFTSLARLLKPGQMVTNPVELLTYEVDAANERGLPDAVVFPESVDDVVRVARWAAGHGAALVARGAGTGLSGGAVAEHGGIILEFSRLNRIVEFDTTGRSAVVEPGVVNLRLDAHVKQAGLYYPPDPASGRAATIGGNIAENAGGPHCFKYGVTTNYLTGLEVVLADGRMVRFGGRALDYPEYDFVGVLTGSEGTLGIITQASVRLLRNPPSVKTMMAAFDAVEDAGEAVSALIAGGLVPATMEFMDREMMGVVEAYAHAGLPVESEAALIIEVDGFAESLAPQMDEIVTLLRARKTRDLRVAQTAEERDKIWYGRKSAAGAMARLSPSYYLLDGTVPRSKLAHTLTAINSVCASLALRVAYVFHAGDGNIHPFILIEAPSDPAFMARVAEAGQRLMEICVAQDGSITGEHGVGIEKRRFLPLMYTADELRTMLDVKAVFDPRNLLNPGKIFPEEALEAGERREEKATSAVAPLPPVLAPESTQEAADLIRAALRTEQPLSVRGGGTKSSLLKASGHVLSTGALRGVRKYAPADLYVTVGAGTPLAELQAELARDRMWVPLASPWPEATIGGMVAANFNAPLRMRYGGVRDLVLDATVVLPNGRTLHTGRPVVKNVAGYDLTKLFIGSYGTLGLITEVTLKLAPLPRARASLIAPVENLGRALEWATRLLRVCLTASALVLCQGCPAYPDAPYTLIYTAEGLAEDVRAELAEARALLQTNGAADPAQVDAPSGSEAWATWLQSAEGQTSGYLARVGAAPKDLPGVVKDLTPALSSDTTLFADLANGLLYLRGANVLAKAREAAIKAGGYAVLLAAPEPVRDVDPWGYIPESLDLMRALKARWDPRGLFNPGAFLV